MCRERKAYLAARSAAVAFQCAWRSKTARREVRRLGLMTPRQATDAVMLTAIANDADDPTGGIVGVRGHLGAVDADPRQLPALVVLVVLAHTADDPGGLSLRKPAGARRRFRSMGDYGRYV